MAGVVGVAAAVISPRPSCIGSGDSNYFGHAGGHAKHAKHAKPREQLNVWDAHLGISGNSD